jgi:hypothetical protein
MMHPNEMLSLINTRIVDIPPRLKLLIWPVLSRRSAAPVGGKAPMRPNQLAVLALPSWSPLLLAPLQESAEQNLAIGFALGHTASRPIHESLEIATGIILG